MTTTTVRSAESFLIHAINKAPGAAFIFFFSLSYLPIGWVIFVLQPGPPYPGAEPDEADGPAGASEAGGE